MAVKCTPVVFITANVGSIFEEPSVMLKIWTREFLSTIARLDPKFIALHCQEVGGKNYEKSMQHVDDFVKLLMNSDELRLFDKARVFLDEDYSSAENFTALGNFYFIHESIKDALIYDFQAKSFTEVCGKEVHGKNIEHVPTKEKSKFPLQYFSECKWSRKGFLRTRWRVNGVVFDLINIHLFHDASNFEAAKSFPSKYSDTRRRALAYTLERFQTDEYGPVPLFIFGDFNFRVDTKGVVKHLSEGLKCTAPEALNFTSSEGEVPVIEFKMEDKVILSLGKKEFSHCDHQNLFSNNDGNWLREFDKEMDAFSDQLFEFSINFPPSYPFEENSSSENLYMKTRCPSWCDRVILSHSAVPLVRDNTAPNNVEYGLMGRDVCMGDHKPVYLKINMNGSTENETCPEPNPPRMLPKPNAQDINSGIVAKDGDGTEASSDKTVPDKPCRSPGFNYAELDIEKLACGFENLISQNSAVPRELEENIEPDLSKCTTCRTHQRTCKVVGNPGGEQVSNGPPYVEDEKILGLLAYEIKVPESAMKKLDVNDTGQKSAPAAESPESNERRGDDERPDVEADRFGAVKRVNSASLVENKPKKEDWKNTRCNSDVSWKPGGLVCRQSPEVARIWGINKSFNRGNSRVRLISSSNSLNVSLPRLTSHHSSSDEEWFEEIEESDDDVLQVACEDTSVNRKPSRVRKDEEEGNGEMATKGIGDRSPPLSDIQSESFSSSEALVDGIRAGSDSEDRTISKDRTDDSGEVEVTDSSGAPVGSAARKPLPEGVKSDEMPAKKSKSFLRPGSDITDAGPKPSEKRTSKKTFSILRRLTEGHKESNNGLLSNGKGADNRESFENLIVEPNLVTPEESELRSENLSDLREVADRARAKLPEKLVASLAPENFGDEARKSRQFDKYDLITKDSVESWETIELGDRRHKDGENANHEFSNDIRRGKTNREKCHKRSNTNCCCTLQ